MFSHKFFKNFFIVCLSIIFFLSLCSVCAFDRDLEDNSTLTVESFQNNGTYDDLLTKTYSLDGGKFSDIQKIVDKAQDGDTIRLSGTFKASDEDSIIKINKKLTITSRSSATLNGKDISGIFALSQKSKGSVISNLKFINGYRFSASAMFIDAKDITIKNCIFEDNVGFGNGGGAVATYWDKDRSSGLTIQDSTFRKNVAPASSGALAAFSTNFKIINCLFEENAAFNNVGRTAYEGALQVGMDGTSGIVSGCKFINNFVESDDDNIPSHGGATGIRKGTVIEIVILREMVQIEVVQFTFSHKAL